MGAALVVILMLLVMFGTKLSGRVLATIVSVKLVGVILVIAVGARHVDKANYTPFVPDVVSGAGARGSVLQSLLGGSGDAFGVMGIFTAAGVIVFAFIGFDLIATAAEDAREPRRSVPRAMLAAIGIVTALYVAMASVLVGLRPYKELGTDAPVSDALKAVGTGWAADVINVCALLALTTVVLVVLIAQSRVLFAMGRDGLLPPMLSRVGAESTPTSAALVAGVAAAALALDPGTATREQLLVLGTLFAFGFCAVGVITLRRTQPTLERGFRVPLGAGRPRPVAAGDDVAVAEPHRHHVARLRHLDGRRPGAVPALRTAAQRARGQLRTRAGRRASAAAPHVRRRAPR